MFELKNKREHDQQKLKRIVVQEDCCWIFCHTIFCGNSKTQMFIVLEYVVGSQHFTRLEVRAPSPFANCKMLIWELFGALSGELSKALFGALSCIKISRQHNMYPSAKTPTPPSLTCGNQHHCKVQLVSTPICCHYIHSFWECGLGATPPLSPTCGNSLSIQHHCRNAVHERVLLLVGKHGRGSATGQVW